MQRVKITVLRKEFYPDLADAYLTDGQSVGPCSLLQAGDTFIYEGSSVMPKGFCPWAWIDIYRNVTTLAAGGTYRPWSLRDGQTIACCTDGIRPVVFNLEVIADAGGEMDQAGTE